LSCLSLETVEILRAAIAATGNFVARSSPFHKEFTQPLREVAENSKPFTLTARRLRSLHKILKEGISCDASDISKISLELTT